MMVDLVQNTDRKINKLLEDNQVSLVVQCLDSLTALGSVYLNLIALGFLWSFGQVLIARELLIGLSLTWIIIYSLKHIIKRERPENHIEHVLARASFPSAHSGNAFLTTTVLSSHLGRSVIFFSLAATVAFSRIYLEDHYLSDVIAGSGIGLVIGQVLITV